MTQKDKITDGKAGWPDMKRWKSIMDRVARPQTNEDYDMLALALLTLILGLAVG